MPSLAHRTTTAAAGHPRPPVLHPSSHPSEASPAPPLCCLQAPRSVSDVLSPWQPACPQQVQVAGGGGCGQPSKRSSGLESKVTALCWGLLALLGTGEWGPIPQKSYPTKGHGAELSDPGRPSKGALPQASASELGTVDQPRT